MRRSLCTNTLTIYHGDVDDSEKYFIESIRMEKKMVKNNFRML